MRAIELPGFSMVGRARWPRWQTNGILRLRAHPTHATMDCCTPSRRRITTTANHLRPVRHASGAPCIILHFARAEPPQACRIRPGTVRYKHCAAKLLLVCIGVPRALRWKRHGGVDLGMGHREPGKLPCRQVESSRTPGPAAVTTVIVPAHRRPVFDSGCC